MKIAEINRYFNLFGDSDHHLHPDKFGGLFIIVLISHIGGIGPWSWSDLSR